MVLNFSNFLQHEFIGLKCTHNKKYNDYKLGTIIDETKNTLVINYNGKNKRIIKNNSVLIFKITDNIVKVEGKNLNNRPEDRLKKKNKRSW